MTEQTDSPINVEQIMQEIRAEILAQKQGQTAGEKLNLPMAGRRFPPEFYEHLYQANMSFDEIQVSLQIQKSTTPLIGPWIDRVKLALHQLVLFYVQQVAQKQMEVNKQILGALNSLVQELEDEIGDAHGRS